MCEIGFTSASMLESCVSNPLFFDSWGHDCEVYGLEPDLCYDSPHSSLDGVDASTECCACSYCALCPAGTYMDPFGERVCVSCPSRTTSENGTVGVYGCRCVEGFVGNPAGPCFPVCSHEAVAYEFMRQHPDRRFTSKEIRESCN